MFVLIDNYDSFTYNLLHFMGELGAEVVVHRNDKVTVEAVMAANPTGIVLSPGPCDPDRAGICLDLVMAAAAVELPLLGVCLGHQTIGQAFGGRVVRAPVPMHGKISAMRHDGAGVFEGLTNPFEATRYHSLMIARDSVPATLTVTAETDDGLVMGLRHNTLPIHGVQFHPESIASQNGHRLLANFLALAGFTGTAMHPIDTLEHRLRKTGT
ncbi:MAG: aminodeoxychorismate/anthranilate synthase component II [Pseudomonadota bacterium]|nr:aminodeoxychorismate/anthranilate synthase component II [Pseudomonadota bacterium]